MAEQRVQRLSPIQMRDLDIRIGHMFQHVTVLVSFIFAIALTHVFSSGSQLLLARDCVRLSASLAVAMLNAAMFVHNIWFFVFPTLGS